MLYGRLVDPMGEFFVARASTTTTARRGGGRGGAGGYGGNSGGGPMEHDEYQYDDNDTVSGNGAGGGGEFGLGLGARSVLAAAWDEGGGGMEAEESMGGGAAGDSGLVDEKEWYHAFTLRLDALPLSYMPTALAQQVLFVGKVGGWGVYCHVFP